jgi:hypothetical protein
MIQVERPNLFLVFKGRYLHDLSQHLFLFGALLLLKYAPDDGLVDVVVLEVHRITFRRGDTDCPASGSLGTVGRRVLGRGLGRL